MAQQECHYARNIIGILSCYSVSKEIHLLFSGEGKKLLVAFHIVKIAGRGECEEGKVVTTEFKFASIGICIQNETNNQRVN
jgi:hypothetical protein